MNKTKQAYFDSLFYSGKLQELDLVVPLLKLRKWVHESELEKDFAVKIVGFEIKIK